MGGMVGVLNIVMGQNRGLRCVNKSGKCDLMKFHSSHEESKGEYSRKATNDYPEGTVQYISWILLNYICICTYL